MSQALNDIEKVIGVGECFELHVTGYSMLPLLGAGDDHIIVRRIDAEENIVGRIAMFRNSTWGIIVHRVLCVHNDIVVLRGDGNLVQTEQCLRSEIIGVVDKVRRSDDKIVDCTTQKWIRRERRWLSTPRIIRRIVLAIMRRWLDFKRN